MLKTSYFIVYVSWIIFGKCVAVQSSTTNDFVSFHFPETDIRDDVGGTKKNSALKLIAECENQAKRSLDESTAQNNKTSTQDRAFTSPDNTLFSAVCFASC